MVATCFPDTATHAVIGFVFGGSGGMNTLNAERGVKPPFGMSAWSSLMRPSEIFFVHEVGSSAFVPTKIVCVLQSPVSMQLLPPDALELTELAPLPDPLELSVALVVAEEPPAPPLPPAPPCPSEDSGISTLAEKIQAAAVSGRAAAARVPSKRVGLIPEAYQSASVRHAAVAERRRVAAEHFELTQDEYLVYLQQICCGMPVGTTLPPAVLWVQVATGVARVARSPDCPLSKMLAT
jgi:hypothetical protein